MYLISFSIYIGPGIGCSWVLFLYYIQLIDVGRNGFAHRRLLDRLDWVYTAWDGSGRRMSYDDFFFQDFKIPLLFPYLYL